MDLLPALTAPTAAPALRMADQVWSYHELAGWAAGVATAIGTAERVAVWATPQPSTVVAIVAALLAGVPVIPLNPASGPRELAHIRADSALDRVFAGPDEPPHPVLADCWQTLPTGTAHRPVPPRAELSGRAPALIVYTSGTTGPAKGVVLPRQAVAANLDALATVWQWTARDTVVHGLPLFHVHGLVLATLGPLRLGGLSHHIGQFTVDRATAGLAAGASMLFGVPTMYHRLAASAERDPSVATALAGARLLVSGSAPLAAADHRRIARATGQRVLQRYGLTETLINCAVPVDGDARPDTVGPALPGVQVRLVDDDGHELSGGAAEAVGEIQVRGPNLFLGYLGRGGAPVGGPAGDWFATGDLGTRSPDGYLRVLGRRSTDLIKTGGFKVGAIEVEQVLLDHPAVAEVAVTGAADPDLGERIVAWVVPVPGTAPRPADLIDWVAGQLAPHKRPRLVHLLDRLPRNELGKVVKTRLAVEPAGLAPDGSANLSVPGHRLEPPHDAEGAPA